jgi:hypothetical protein
MVDGAPMVPVLGEGDNEGRRELASQLVAAARATVS